MSDGYGMLSHVGISFQDSFGTANVGSMHYFKVINETLTHNIEFLKEEGMQGRFEEGDNYLGYETAEGEITIDAHPILVGKLLQAWTNAASNVTITGSCYNHVFVPATADFDDLAAVQPMTIECYRDAGSAFMYYDVLADTLSFEIAQNAFVRVTMGVVGGKFAKMEKTTPSYLPGSNYTYDQASLSFGGAGVDEVVNMTINMQNNLEGKGTLDGTRTSNRVKRTDFRRMDIAGTILFTSQTEADKYANNTAQKIVATITGQAISSGYNSVLSFIMPRVPYTAFPPQIGGAGQIEVGFTGDVKYDAGSGHMTKITLVNTHAQGHGN